MHAECISDRQNMRDRGGLFDITLAGGRGWRNTALKQVRKYEVDDKFFDEFPAPVKRHENLATSRRLCCGEHLPRYRIRMRACRRQLPTMAHSVRRDDNHHFLL